MAERHFLGGATNTTLHIETDGTMHVEEIQDVEPIMDYAHAMRNERFSADALDGMWRHAAEIPFVIFQEECKRHGVPADIGSAQGDMVIEIIMRDPKYARFLAAPATRDPHVIMKGRR